MLFNSPIFLFVFLPVTLIGFGLVHRLAPRLAAPWLLAASLVFYAWWSVQFLLLLIGSTIVNWALAQAIADSGPRRSQALLAGLVWNLGLLAYFKYADFFIDTINRAGVNWPLLHVVLPLGISFFTFQKIAYLVDIHRGTAKPGRFLDFALFVFFFPQLIAGPIVHHAEMMPQFKAMEAAPRASSTAWRDGALGLTLLIIGLVKKVAIADQIAPLSSSVFDTAGHGTPIGAMLAWQAALAYTAQLYFDFSGYSDMAIGLARMFGIVLPANFLSPYRATSIIAFWRRWHITLSRFLRDYLYVPLGGNRKGPLRRYVNLMIVMLLGGLWHGAGWTFVIWGGLHGLYLLVAHAWRGLTKVRVPAVAGWSLTMLAVVVAWVLFRAPTLAAAGDILVGMSGAHGWNTAVSTVYLRARPTALLFPIAALAFAALAPNALEITRRFGPVLEAIAAPAERWRSAILWQPNRALAVLAAVLSIVVLTLSWKTSEFLYFQF